ncbi:MAG: phosphoglycerate dehydrogenase [Vicinamibacterales bacterium]
MSDPSTSFPKHRIKVLLLENIHASAADLLAAEGFQVATHRSALDGPELVDALRDVHVLGIRSRTDVRLPALIEAKRLLAIGCFCIGTNQVDLDAARLRGIPVFNAPFANTRSVAELALAEIIALSRQLGDRSRDLHAGRWRKATDGASEVRGKTLGIVGYGHIGSQLGVLAEAIGLRVIFHDIARRMALGNAREVGFDPLLAEADFVSLHVPQTERTRHLVGAAELGRMKPGAFLLNLSRGTVVDLDATADALRRGHLGGCAIDVYPSEPERDSDAFVTPLQGLPNVLLTPHVGGSTHEAQAAIGRQVASTLARFVNAGTTAEAVNFPRLDVEPEPGRHRILNVHRNVPGVLRDINRIVGDVSANVHRQALATDADIGYLIMDLDQDLSNDVRAAIGSLPTSVRTRILY